MRRIKLFGIIIVISVLCTFAFAQTNIPPDIWKDGFLEKSYIYPLKKVNSAIDAILGYTEGTSDIAYGQLVVLQIQKIDKDVQVVTYGVGDKNGKLGKTMSGVGGIKGFTTKEGGSRLQVKVTQENNAVTVGFKVDDGDRSSSETLHNLLAQKLIKMTSTK
jgi:hypothetical protein